MVVWTSGFHNPLIHTDFNMFVDEWTSANESPEKPVRTLMSHQSSEIYNGDNNLSVVVTHTKLLPLHP